MADGWELTFPQRPQHVLLYVLAGTGYLAAAQRHLPIKANDLVIIPSGRVHRMILHDPAVERPESVAPQSATVGFDDSLRIVEAGEGDAPWAIEALCGEIEPSAVGGLLLLSGENDPFIGSLAEDSTGRALFAELVEEITEARPGRRAIVRSLLERSLIVVLRQKLASGEIAGSWAACARDPQMAQTLATLLQDPAEDHTVDDLARRCGMSRSAFMARFSGTFGTPPMTMLREMRLRRAAQLLREGGQVKGVAATVGFSSRSHFSRLFTERYGVAPSEWAEGGGGPHPGAPATD